MTIDTQAGGRRRAAKMDPYRLAEEITSGQRSRVDSTLVEGSIRLLKPKVFDQPTEADLYAYFNLCMYAIQFAPTMAAKLEYSFALLAALPEGFKPEMVALVEDNLGLFLQTQGLVEAASYHFQRAIALTGRRSADPLNHLGYCLYKFEKCYPRAERLLLEAVKLDAEHYQALNNLLLLCLTKKDYARALSYAERLERVAIPDRQIRAAILVNLAGLYATLAEQDKAAAFLNRSMDVLPTDVAHTQRVFWMLHDPGTSPRAILDEHHRWIRSVYPFIGANALARTPIRREGAAPIHVGFVSADFFDHPVGDFLVGLLRNLATSGRWRVTCYATKADHAERGAKTFPFVQWANLEAGGAGGAGGPSGTGAAVRKIRDDGVQILIDLNGHTTGNRLDVFAARAAPVQMTYLGYPGTTGLPTMDYRITDRGCDGPETEAFYTEKLLYMPGCFLNYTPRRALDVPVGRRSGGGGRVVFGCFNRVSKINSEVLSVWKRLLDDVTDGVLMLKSHDFDVCGVEKKLMDAVVASGIGRERVVLAEHSPTHDDHIRMYGEIDVALDPFPYSGTTSTCEALYMGVPVITWRCGANHVQDVSASILLNSGICGEFVASTKDEYVALAKAAADRVRADAAGFRAAVAEAFRSGRVCQAGPFVSAFESVLESSIGAAAARD